MKKCDAPPTTRTSALAQRSAISVTSAGPRYSSCWARASNLGRGSAASPSTSWTTTSGGAIASQASTRASRTESAISAPNDQPVRINGMAGESRSFSAATAVSASTRSRLPKSCMPSLPSTPRKLNRRHATPCAGSASNSALITMERIVPPYCGCGWQSTTPQRGASAGIDSSASSVTPSAVLSSIGSGTCASWDAAAMARTFDFDRETAIRPLGDGRYEAYLDRAWWVHRGPNGGYLAAIVLRALTETVGDAGRAPRSLTVHYAAPPTEGALGIATSIERAGRSLTTGSARLSQGDKL